MYNVKNQVLTLEIPKCGSRSLCEATRIVHGKNSMKWMGHHTLNNFMDDYRLQHIPAERQPTFPLTVVAVIRNPVERFFSQVRQLERNKQGIQLQRIMEIAWNQSDVVFKPQWKFLQCNKLDEPLLDIRKWNMGRLAGAVSVSAGKPIHSHRNKSPGEGQYGRDQIMEHDLFDELMDSDLHYGPDLHLWLEACRTNSEGKAK